MPPPHPCHPDRSVAKWRDLQFAGPQAVVQYLAKLQSALLNL
jgi:hypothetical protein